MSRIGKLPVAVPEKVKVDIIDEGQSQTIKVEGPKGKLQKSFNSAHVTLSRGEEGIAVTPAGRARIAKAMHGTARSIIAGMVNGVVNGYEKKLEINGVGFRATVQGQNLKLELGYSHDINYAIPAGIDIKVENNTNVTVSGVDKHMVGQVTADIYQYYPVEPYKGKGVRIVGQYVRRKEGKKAG